MSILYIYHPLEDVFDVECSQNYHDIPPPFHTVRAMLVQWVTLRRERASLDMSRNIYVGKSKRGKYAQTY